MTTPNNPKRQPIILSRPRDESLEAFKDWITEFYEKLTGKTDESDMTEQEWEEDWREFWDKSHSNEHPHDDPQNDTDL